MPLYEYRCDACGHQFEVIQKFSDEPIAVCPKCGSGPVVKLLSSPAFQFKGTGWYITDYARKGTTEGKDGEGHARDGIEGRQQEGRLEEHNDLVHGFVGDRHPEHVETHQHLSERASALTARDSRRYCRPYDRPSSFVAAASLSDPFKYSMNGLARSGRRSAK